MSAEMPILDSPLDDFAIQAELDVREMGFSHPSAVDVAMQIWSMGLRAGIGYARETLVALDREESP